MLLGEIPVATLYNTADQLMKIRCHPGLQFNIQLQIVGQLEYNGKPALTVFDAEVYQKQRSFPQRKGCCRLESCSQLHLLVQCILLKLPDSVFS